MLEFSKESKKQGNWEDAGVLVQAAGSMRAPRTAWERRGGVVWSSWISVMFSGLIHLHTLHSTYLYNNQSVGDYYPHFIDKDTDRGKDIF